MLKKILILILVLALGAGIGRYLAPTKIIEKEVIKEVIKEVKVEDKDIKKNKVTIRIVTEKPDGTKVTETKIFDKSEIEITTKSEIDKVTVVEKEKITEFRKDEYMISLAAKTPLTSPTITYGLIVHRRMLGPIWIGVGGFLDTSVAGSIGLTF